MEISTRRVKIGVIASRAKGLWIVALVPHVIREYEGTRETSTRHSQRVWYLLLDSGKGSLVTRIDARWMTESPCAITRPAQRIGLDVIHDIVRTSGIPGYAAHARQVVKI